MLPLASCLDQNKLRGPKPKNKNRKLENKNHDKKIY
jgi:hypothetical protein